MFYGHMQNQSKTKQNQKKNYVLLETVFGCGSVFKLRLPDCCFIAWMGKRDSGTCNLKPTFLVDETSDDEFRCFRERKSSVVIYLKR